MPLSLCLASSSPQRQEILRNLGIPFTVREPSIEEKWHFELSPPARIEHIALQKLYAVLNSGSVREDLVLSCDTAIVSGDKCIGKAKNYEEAWEMWRSYSASSHAVISVLACFSASLDRVSIRHSQSTVYFKKITDREIQAYLSTNEWKNVAGAYRIQGRAAFFIEKISGSYSGIVGLPVDALYEVLSAEDYTFF